MMIYVVVEQSNASIALIGEVIQPSVKVFHKLSLAQDYYESRRVKTSFVYPVKSLKINFQKPLFLLVSFDKDGVDVFYGTSYKKNLEPVRSFISSTLKKDTHVLIASD